MVIIILFHILFFYKNYTSWCMSTSELLSTFFPSWLFIGRHLRAGRSWKNEPCYWLNFHSHPVLSSYYPVHVLTALLGTFLSLNSAFMLLARSVLLHHLFMNIGWYLFFRQTTDESTALFLSIAISYCAYFLKQQPCLMYTIAWFPYTLMKGWFSCIALGMMVLSGYYPLMIYLVPFTMVFNPLSLLGIVIGLPQIIPFLRYLPKTIYKDIDKNPNVGPTEKNFFFGITPLILAITNFSYYYLLLPLPIILSYLKITRIPMRVFVIALVGFFLILRQTHVGYPFIILLCLELWIYNRLLPPPIYSELYNKPSLAFNNKLTKFLSGNECRVSGLPFPLFTGIINNIKTLGYCGCMQNKLMFKWRKDDQHDWFRNHADSESLDRSRVRFAFSRKKIDNWKPTIIRNLYENPRIS